MCAPSQFTYYALVEIHHISRIKGEGKIKKEEAEELYCIMYFVTYS
jgi:hypothetical protein